MNTHTLETGTGAQQARAERRVSMSIVIASVVLAVVWIGSESAHVGYMNRAIMSVLLVAVVFFLVGLSFETLRQFSGQDSSLELPGADQA